VVDGRFDGRILLRNAQLYQLALVLLVLRDLDEGYVQLGSGTTRGNGWVRAEIRRLVIETRAGKNAAGRLAGVGGLGEDLGPYELFATDAMPLPGGLRARPLLVWDQLEVAADGVDALAMALVAGPWQGFLEQARGRKWDA